MARALVLGLGILNFIAVGCTAHVSPPPEALASRSPTALATPSSATPANVILRMTVYEPPTPAMMREPPEFSLYADGRVIYTRPRGDGGFDLRHAQLNETAMGDLTDLAIAALRDKLPSYNDLVAAERSTTAFDISTPDLSTSVWVYALGEEDDRAPSRADRAAMRPLREDLLNFDSEVRVGNALDLGAYEAERYLVELFVAHRELPVKIDWPWPALGVEDFEQVEPRQLERVMTSVELHDVLALEDGDFLVATAPDGVRYGINLTPLLPDQLVE